MAWLNRHEVTRPHFYPRCETLLLTCGTLKLQFTISLRINLRDLRTLLESLNICTFIASIKIVDKIRVSPLWSGGQSSWVRIQRSGFDSRRYQILWEVVGLERSPLSLVSTIERSSGSGLESREYGRRDPSRWPRGTPYPQTLALTSPTSGGHSVGIIRSRTQATEFSLDEILVPLTAFKASFVISLHLPCSAAILVRGSAYYSASNRRRDAAV
jgi:hypothetical protein